MTIELGTLIAVLGTVLGIVFGYLGYQRATKKEVKEEVKEDTAGNTELRTNLEYIRRGVDDIRIDLKAQENRVGELSERVIRIEESSKQAHKRLDSLER